MWEGGIAKVADLSGRVRIERLGTLLLRRSAERVSILRKGGWLGRRLRGGGRWKIMCDGGGDGVRSVIRESCIDREGEEASDITGRSEEDCCDIADEGSTSSRGFDREAECVSSWNSPPPLFDPLPPACGGGESILKPKFSSPPDMTRVSRAELCPAAEIPPLR